MITKRDSCTLPDETARIAFILCFFNSFSPNTVIFSLFSVAIFFAAATINEGLATGGSTTTITLNALADSENNTYNDQVVFIRSGAGQDQAAIINDYNGTSRVATIIGSWRAPDTTSAYAILPTGLSRADASGPGGDQVSVFVFSDVGETQPIVGAQVWITTDAAGNNFLAGSLFTDDNGQVTFLLTAGNTYYKWVRAAGFNPVLGDSFVAVED